MVVAKLCTSVPTAEGPRTDAQRPRKTVRTKSARNWMKGAKLDRRERIGERMELGRRGILHAGSFLFHGLLLEYNIQSDCPVHE